MTKDKSSSETPRERHETGIWWVASYPKSGSTWLRMVINTAVSGFPPDINAQFQYVSSDNLDGVMALTCGWPREQIGPLLTALVRPAMLVNHLAVHCHRDACLKTHHANLAVVNMPLCPPYLSKGAVYVVRDPRDVCVSFAKHLGCTIDEMIDFMKEPTHSIVPNLQEEPHRYPLPHFLHTWSTHVESWLHDKNQIPTMGIRYEDMHANPHATFRHALNAIGLTDTYVSEERLDYAIEQAGFRRLKQQEDTHGFAEAGLQGQFFNRGKVGTWKDVLTATQAARIEDDHREIMTHFAYVEPVSCTHTAQ